MNKLLIKIAKIYLAGKALNGILSCLGEDDIYPSEYAASTMSLAYANELLNQINEPKMNRTRAREIAQTITNEQLVQMFESAKTGIKDWTRISDVNKGMTKGTAWNVLASGFDPGTEHPVIAKTNMIREFGEYLPNSIKFPPKEKKKFEPKQPVHQEPKFN
jgi:hypothetical protein